MSESPLVHKAGGAAVDPEDFNALVDVVAAGGGVGGGGGLVTIDPAIGDTALTINEPDGAAADGDSAIAVIGDTGGSFYVTADGGMNAAADSEMGSGHSLRLLVGGDAVPLLKVDDIVTLLLGLNDTALGVTVGTTSGTTTTAAFQALHTSGVPKIGFFAQTPAAQPTVTGSRGGNAALASLLTALSNLGLITNSTTA